MKIIDNTSKETTFNDLNVGDVFKYKDYFRMRTENLYDGENSETINAVDLTTGSLCVFCGHETVVTVEATLTVNRKEN